MNLQALTPFLPLLLGPIATLLTQALKKIPAVPDKSAPLVRVLLAVVSLALVLLAHWSNGTLSTADLNEPLRVLVDVLLVYLGGIATYDHRFPTKKKELNAS